MAQKQANDVLITLSSVENSAYIPYANYLKGQAYVMLKQYIKAADKYQKCYDSLNSNTLSAVERKLKFLAKFQYNMIQEKPLFWGAKKQTL